MDTQQALLTSALERVRANAPHLTKSDVEALALVVGQSTLVAALDILDHEEAALLHLPNGRRMHQVSGSQTAYTVMPDVPYCPCPAYQHGVLYTRTHLTCKHLLAVWIGERQGCLVEKTMPIDWISAFVTGFKTSASVVAR